MLIPVFIFLIFLLLLYYSNKSTNQYREKLYQNLIEKLGSEIQLFIIQVKTSTISLGFNNNNFLFNNCDFYLTKNAIVILGYSKNSLFKQLSLPIILTKDVTEFSNKYPHTYVKKIIKINFDNGNVKINFGDKEIFKTEVFLTIKEISEIDLNKIKHASEMNCW